MLHRIVRIVPYGRYRTYHSDYYQIVLMYLQHSHVPYRSGFIASNHAAICGRAPAQAYSTRARVKPFITPAAPLNHARYIISPKNQKHLWRPKGHFFPREYPYSMHSIQTNNKKTRRRFLHRIRFTGMGLSRGVVSETATTHI